MRTTYPEASFCFVDVTALADSQTASTTAKDFSNYPLFCDQTARQAPYGTLERNQFLLDGSREIFPAAGPEDVHGGAMRNRTRKADMSSRPPWRSPLHSPTAASG